MEQKKFDEVLDRIKAGSFPPVLGHSITAEQYLRIQSACGDLVMNIPPGDTKRIEMITKNLGIWRSKIGPDFTEESRKLLPLMEKLQQVIDGHQTSDMNDSLLIVHGDKKNQKAHFNIYGDIQSAAMTFTSLLDSESSDFKRFIFSLIGTYLAKNPEDHDMFLKGIEAVKNTAGIN